VALARSMVYQPQLLLLDEPLSNLDAQLRLRLRDDLRGIIKRVGLTALYVTHDQTEAVVLGDRIGVMRDGRLLQYDTPEAIYHTPADLFVAGFTGASNMISGRVLDRQGEFGTIAIGGDGAGQRLLARMPQEGAGGACGGAEVRVALRPDNVQFSPADGPNRFDVQILAQRYQGTQTMYDLDLFGSRIEALDIGSSPRFPVGTQVRVALPPDACWAYPA
jgi:iron(III) transport system ATP-binding protein